MAIRWIILAILLLVMPQAVWAGESGQYPANAVDRPLILPKESGEISLGPSVLGGNERRDVAPIWNVRYALTENLEIARLGFRYRFINEENQQWAVALQNHGLDLNLNHHTSLGLEGKQIISPNWAILYGLGYYFARSHEKDGRSHEGRASVGAIFRVSEKSALKAEYSYRRLSGFDATSANVFKVSAFYNVLPSLDLVVGYGYSDFNEAVDSVLFNESYRNRFDILLNWRFKFP